MKADEALARLREGNERFRSGLRSVESFVTPAHIAESAKGQSPFAIVLACSDSRVPVELLFDQGVGDLFVMRVAGNVVAPSIVGSAEFAAATFGTRLVLVLGHSKCGAVGAAVDVEMSASHVPSDNIRDIVERIQPTVKSVLEAEPALGRDAAIERCVRANVRYAADQLRHGSRVLEELTRTDGLKVVGAEYDLATGRVEIFGA